MTTLTLQQVFDNALFGIRKQSYEPSMRLKEGGPTCVYRGEEGRKCGLGWSLPEELAERMDLEPMPGIYSTHHMAGDLFKDISAVTLERLQSCHDQGCTDGNPAQEFELRMQAFAVEYGLKYTPRVETATHLLVFEGRPVSVGEVLKNFRGEELTILGGYPPEVWQSTGRITTDKGSFYPSIVSASWVAK